MRVLGLLTFLMSLSACSNSQGINDDRSKNSSTNKSQADQENSASAFEDAASEAEDNSGQDPLATVVVNGESYGECLSAMGVDSSSVTGISQGRVDVSTVTADSVLYLNPYGQANIDLSSQALSKIKGICIDSSGGAQLSVALNATVGSVFYYGRESSSTNLNFRETGSVDRLLSNVAEQSMLDIQGQSLDCGSLNLAQDTANPFVCRGTKIY